MGFELEKRLATELNRLAEDQGDERDHVQKKPAKQIERIKRIAAELKERLLGGVAEEDVPGKRSAVEDAMSAAVRKLEQNVRRITSFDTLPWKQKATFDSFRERGLREVLDAVGNRKLRAATIASADKGVASRTGEKAAARPSPTGQAMWRVAERRAATLYRHAQEAGEVASDDPVVDEALARAGSGHALPADVRKQMERELGISLARVRVHTDPVAAAAAKAVKASAFTVGEDIFFAHNAFAPDTREGKKLLAHELTHVVQAYQGRTHAGGTGITVSQPGEGLEREADAMAERVERKTSKTSRRRGAQPRLAEPAAVRSSGKSAHVLRKQADAGAANNQDEHDPNKGVKPKLTFLRDHARDQAQKHSIAGPVQRVKGAAQQLSQQLNAATKGPISELKSTSQQLRAKPPGHDAKNEHRAHQKHHEHHQNEAKHAAKQAQEHAKHAAQHHKPEHHAPAKDTTGTGPIHFKAISDWSKYMPEALPNQDARERKRILGLVQKSVNEDRKESSKLLNQLRVAQVKQAASVRGMLPGLQSTIRGGQSAALGRVSAAEASQTSAVKAAVAGQQAAVRSTAAAMVGQITAAHAAAKSEIKAAHQAAVQFLQQSKDKAIQDIAQACQTECSTVHNLYEDCKNRVIALGAAKAGEAQGVPATVSLPYSGDKLDAAKKAAQDVASQYAEAMPSEAADAAGKIGESEPDAITQIEKIATDNQKQLEEAFTQAKDALDQSMEQANTACDQIKEQAISQVNSTATTTVGQLAALGASQVAAIQQQAAGARQGIQSAGGAALQSVASGVSNAANGIEKGALGLIKGAKQIEAPSSEETKKAVQDSAAQLAQGTKQIGAGLHKSASGAVAGMNGQAQSAAGGMAQTATAAKQSATQMGQSASRAITQLGQASSDSLKQLSGNYKTGADDMAKKADESFKKVVEGTKKAYDGITNQVTTNLNGAYTNVQSSFDAAVPAKEREDILANAKKAADAVKPWWQKALAFVASVVVAIVVSVVVVALIVTTGPVGAILVGAAAGALGSVAGQMASNLILGNGLMDGITWQSVALGAVGGAIGAGFSQGVTAGARALSAGGSRFASAGARVVTAMGEGSSGLGNFAIKTGIGVAGDQVSDVASQLIVTGHYEFSMENLATSLVTNGLTSTKKYGELEHAVQGGLQNHVGHIEIGGANGVVSAHGPGSPVPEQGHVGSATGAPQGSAPAAGHSGSHGEAPTAGSHPSGPSGAGPSGAGPSGAHPSGAHPEGGAGPSGPSGSHPSGPDGGAPRTTTGNEPHGSQPRGEQTAQGGAPRENQTTHQQQGGGTQTEGRRTQNEHGTQNEPHGTQGHDQTAHGNEPHGNQPHGPEGTPAHGQNDPHAQHDPAAHPQDGKAAHGQNDPHGQQPKAGEHETAPHGGEHDNAASGGDHDNNAAHGGDHDNAGGDNTAHAGGDDANAHAGPESESAGELADMGYPNATHQKAEQAAGAIESGNKPTHDSVRDTEANQQGLHELDKVNTDPTLSNESKQNIRRDVAEHMRGEEPTGILDHDVKQARAQEEAKLKEQGAGQDGQQPGHGQTADGEPAKAKLGNDEFSALPPAEQMNVASAEIAEGAHTFASQDAAAKWGRENLQHEVVALPGQEKQSIHNYTNEPGNKGHAGPTYKEMNSVLRADATGHTSPHDTAAVRQDIAHIDAAMNKNRLPETVTVVRGTGNSHLDVSHPSELVGQVLTDHAYMSTSLGDNGTVSAFADKPMILHLQVPAGHEALWVEPVGAFGGGERELLLGRGTQYEITRAFIGPDGKWHVYGHVLSGGGGGGGGGGAKSGGSPSGATPPASSAPKSAAPAAPSGSTPAPAASPGGTASGSGHGFISGSGRGSQGRVEIAGTGRGGHGGGHQHAGGQTADTASTIQVQTLKPAAEGGETNRRTVGVAEAVRFTAPGAGNWTQTTGRAADGSSPTNVNTYVWKAPSTAGSSTITFTPADGSQASTVSITVIAPAHVRMTKLSEYDFSAGTVGAGMEASVAFHPMTVSFGNLQWKEDTDQAGTRATGWFRGSRTLQIDLPVHHATESPLPIGDDNGGPHDDIQFSGFAATDGRGNPVPYTAGSFRWIIGQNYLVRGETALHHIEDLHQICTMQGGRQAGRLTVTKGGASVSRAMNQAPRPQQDDDGSAGRGIAGAGRGINILGVGKGDEGKDAKPATTGGTPQPGGESDKKEDRGGRLPKGAAPQPKPDGKSGGHGGAAKAGGQKGAAGGKGDSAGFAAGGIDGNPLKAQLTAFNTAVNEHAGSVKQPEGTDGKPKKDSEEDHDKKVSQYEDGVDGIADMIGDADGFDDICDSYGGLISSDDPAKRQQGLNKVRQSKAFSQLSKMWQGALDGGPDSARMQAAFEREFSRRGFWGSTQQAYALVRDDAKRQAKEDAEAAAAKKRAKDAAAKAKADADAKADKAAKTAAGKPNAAGINGGKGGGANAAFLNASVDKVAAPMPQFQQLSAVSDPELKTTLASVDHHAGLFSSAHAENSELGRGHQIWEQLKRAGGGFKEGFVDTVKWGVLAHAGNKLLGGAVEKVIGEKVPIVGPIIMLALDPPWTGKYWHDVGAGFSKGGKELANVFSLKAFENCHSVGDYVGVFCAKLADLFGGFYEILQVINKLLTTLSALALILGAVLIGVGIALAWLGVGAGLIAAGGWLVEAGEVLGDISLALMPVCLALSALSLLFRTAAAFLVPADVYAEQLAAEGDAANQFGNQAGQRVGLSTARAVEQATPIEKPTAKAGENGGAAEAKAGGEGDTAKVVEQTKAANDAAAEAAKGHGGEQKPETKPEEHKPAEEPKNSDEHKAEATNEKPKVENKSEHENGEKTNEKGKEEPKNEKANEEAKNEKGKEHEKEPANEKDPKDKADTAKKKSVGRRFAEHLKANLIEAVKMQFSMGRNMKRLTETLGDVPDLFNKGATDRGLSTRAEIFKEKIEKANKQAEELGEHAEKASKELEDAKKTLEAEDGKINDYDREMLQERIDEARRASQEATDALNSYKAKLEKFKSIMDPALERAEAGNAQEVMPTAEDRKGNAGEDEDGAHHSNERKLRHAEDAKVKAEAELKKTQAEYSKLEAEIADAEVHQMQAEIDQGRAKRAFEAKEADPANAEKVAAAEKVATHEANNAKAAELKSNAGKLRSAWDRQRAAEHQLEGTVGKTVEVDGAPHKIVGFGADGVIVEPATGGGRKTVAADKVSGDLPDGFAKTVEGYQTNKATVDKLSEGETGGNPGSIADNMRKRGEQIERDERKVSNSKSPDKRAEWADTKAKAREWDKEQQEVTSAENEVEAARKNVEAKRGERKGNAEKQLELEEKIREEDNRARALRRAKHDHRDNEVYMEKGTEQIAHLLNLDRITSRLIQVIGFGDTAQGVLSWMGLHVLEHDKEEAEKKEEEAKKKEEEAKQKEEGEKHEDEKAGAAKDEKPEGDKKPSEEKTEVKEAKEEKKDAGEKKEGGEEKKELKRTLTNERAEVEEEKEGEMEKAQKAAEKAGKAEATYEQLIGLRPPAEAVFLGDHRKKASEAAAKAAHAHAQAFQAYQAELAVTRLAEESKAMAESGKPIKKRAEGMKDPIEKSKQDEAQRKAKLDGGETGDIKGSDSKMGGLVIDLISKMGDNSDHLSTKPDGGGAKGGDMAGSQDKAADEGKERHGQSKGHSDSQKQFLEQALQVRAKQEASVAQNIQSLEGKSQEEFAIRDEIRVQKANALAEEQQARQEAETESAQFNQGYSKTSEWAKQYEAKRKQLDGGGGKE